MTRDDPEQLTLLDAAVSSTQPDLWEMEKRQTKVGLPRKGEEKAKGSGTAGTQDATTRGRTEDSGSGPGARMRGATPGAPAQRGGGRGSGRPHQENDQLRPGWVATEAGLPRVAREAVVAALRRALGRIRDPARWTPLHLAASRREDDAGICWWARWPKPDAPTAVKWSAEGAVMAVTPDEAVQRLAVYALGRVWAVENEEGHAAALEYIERRIVAVESIEAAYVTRADVWSAVARLPAGGRERDEDDG
jgi:hypothetical protein